MNEAVGNSSLFYIVIFIVGIVMLIVVGSVSYSKAYRVKNRIIQIIENEGVYDEKAKSDISADLKTIGYQTGLNSSCDSDNLNKNDDETYTYKYCVYRIGLDDDGKPDDDKSDDGKYYYKVTTYMHFDFPIIGNFIEIPVHGETKMLGQTYDY